jgi:hypothetical protein
MSAIGGLCKHFATSDRSTESKGAMLLMVAIDLQRAAHRVCEMGETGQLATSLLHSGKSVRPMFVVHTVCTWSMLSNYHTCFQPFQTLHPSSHPLVNIDHENHVSDLPIGLSSPPDGELYEKAESPDIGLPF